MVEDGALAVRDGRIVATGTTPEIEQHYRAREVIDADGALVSPGFADPHSHLLHGGSRHQEYDAKVSGSGTPTGLQSGINYTVRHTRNASDHDLIGQALADLDIMLEHGTTTLEAKTGYGLDRDNRVAPAAADIGARSSDRGHHHLSRGARAAVRICRPRERVSRPRDRSPSGGRAACGVLRRLLRPCELHVRRMSSDRGGRRQAGHGHPRACRPDWRCTRSLSGCTTERRVRRPSRLHHRRRLCGHGARPARPESCFPA